MKKPDELCNRIFPSAADDVETPEEAWRLIQQHISAEEQLRK